MLFLGLLLLATMNGELRYRELLEWERAYEEANTTVVSSGFNGSTNRIREWKLCRGSISFVLCNLPEEEGVVRKVTLHKYLDGEEVSSRVIYTPWYNIMYTLRNHTGGITCHTPILSMVRQGSEIEYWIEAVVSDGTIYRNYAFRLDAEANDIEGNLCTEVYNGQREFQGILPNGGNGKES